MMAMFRCVELKGGTISVQNGINPDELGLLTYVKVNVP